jgi:hypothetical protein
VLGLRLRSQTLSEPLTALSFKEWFKLVPPPEPEIGVRGWRNLVWFDFEEAYHLGLSPEEAGTRASIARKQAARSLLTSCACCSLLVEKSKLESHQQKIHSSRPKRPLNIASRYPMMKCWRCGSFVKSNRVAEHLGSARCNRQRQLKDASGAKSSVWAVRGGRPDSSRSRH